MHTCPPVCSCYCSVTWGQGGQGGQGGAKRANIRKAGPHPTPRGPRRKNNIPRIFFFARTVDRRAVELGGLGPHWLESAIRSYPKDQKLATKILFGQLYLAKCISQSTTANFQGMCLKMAFRLYLCLCLCTFQHHMREDVLFSAIYHMRVLT